MRPAQPSQQLVVLGTSYEPFVRDLRVVTHYSEWFVERVPADKTLASEIDKWKTMSLCGWDITALVAPDSKTVVALGCR